MKDVLTRLVSGSICPSAYLFAINVGSLSHPALEFLSEDMTCATSVHVMSVIAILCSIQLLYLIGLTSLIISLSKLWPIDTIHDYNSL